jgi:hypothetical protein
MSDDPQQLVAYSRERLRSTFLEAGMGITGANFMVAESGTVIVLENEGNGRLVSSLPRCHVMLAGLERVLETTADAAFMIEQLSLAAVGRELPSYVSWLSGPAADGDDGPEEFVVVVVDNGRSRVRESDEREILNCIRAVRPPSPGLPKVGGHAGVGLRWPDRRGPDATADRHAGRAGAQAAVPLIALRCVHRRVSGRHSAPRPPGARSRAGQSGGWCRARRARGLGRLGARLVQPAAVSRLGARGSALGTVRARLRARRELARGARHAAAPEHQALPSALARPGERRVIDAFIAALEADGGQGARVADVATARVYVGELLGEDTTLCFWSGDPLVTSLDPASLGASRTSPRPARASRAPTSVSPRRAPSC